MKINPQHLDYMDRTVRTFGTYVVLESGAVKAERFGHKVNFSSNQELDDLSGDEKEFAVFALNNAKLILDAIRKVN